MSYYESVSGTRRQFLDSYRQGDYLRAVIWGERLLTEQKNNDRADTDDYDYDLFNTACAYEALERYDKAVSLYSEASKGIGKRRGENEQFLLVLNNLAVAHCRRGDYEKARQLFKKACGLCEDIKGKESKDYADLMYNYANACADLEEYAQALKLHFDVLTMRTGCDMDQVNSLHSICYIYEAEKDWTNAILYGEKTLRSIKKLAEKNTEELYKTMYHLAELYENSKNYETSLKLFNVVSKWMEKKLNARHPNYIGCINRMADLYCKKDDFETALSLRLQTLEMIKDTAGDNHIYYANLLKNAAILSKGLDQRDKAETLLQRAIEIKRGLLGEDGFDYIEDLIMLLGFYIEWGMIEKASDMLIQALDNIGMNHEGLNDFIQKAADQNEGGLKELLSRICGAETVGEQDN